METISIKVEENFAGEMEKLMRRHHYTTKTEFIREAIRDKVKELEKEELLSAVRKIHGISKRKTTDAQLHAAREKAFEELEKQFK